MPLVNPYKHLTVPFQNHPAFRTPPQYMTQQSCLCATPWPYF